MTSAIIPVVIVLVSRSCADRPSTTPNTTSPSTMIVNSPNRSTRESLGGTAQYSRLSSRPASAIPTSHPTATPAHTKIRASAGRKALTTIATTPRLMPAT